ncbi:MAG TPA: PQQ-binding-like beta-propeller repeat protein [Steroidobacteraceae bacterium]|nr:PQQ-binding-like beta-propeller repeat protein [Steroidobacteraceae bacterium]
MNARSTSVWIAALALGLGSDVAAAAQASLFVATSHNGVVALDAAGGKLKWQFPYGAAVWGNQ